MLKSKYLILLFSIFCLYINAQSVISGKIYDENSGEGLISAYIYVDGTDKAAATDFDGKYAIEIEPGVYKVKLTYIGYADKYVEDIIVKSGETTYLDISMSEGSENLEEIVVKASAIERSENAVLTLQRKSYKIQDGISSQEMSKMSVGNVASAMTKITGATVQDGKYLNVRGLGDRYSIAQMDGIILPSVDPYKNSAQLDFIPTNIIDNIIASKTFTPDQPGTFTGGNVTIKTKSLPERETFSAGISVEYNTVNNLNNQFLSNTRGKYDFLGYDDGSRALDPAFLDKNNAGYLVSTVPLLSRIGKTEISEGANRLSKLVTYEFDSKRTTSPMDHGINLSYGNSYKTKRGHEIGLIFAGKYNRSYTHRENQIRNQYSIVGELQNFGSYIVDQSIESPTINGFAGLSYKFNSNHYLTLKNIYSHQTEISSRQIIGEDGQNIIAPLYKLGKDNTFTELSLNLTSLSGSHNFPKAGGLNVEWTAATIKSNRYEPELAYLSTQFDAETNLETIPEANVAPPLLFWRDIDDMNYSGKVDLTLPIPAFWNMELKSGAMYEMKTRNSDETSLNIATGNDGTKFSGGNIANFFSQENAGIVGQYDDGDNIIGNYFVDYTNPKNSYKGTSAISAGYFMAIFNPFDNFKFVAGVRAENTDIFAQSKIVQNIESVVADSTNTGIIKSLDFLPAASMIFNISDKQNFRLNYSKTIARPSLREIAPFASWDPILSIFFLGNPNLGITDIYNYDARWEWFLNPGEIIALSVFYKDFNNPISLSVRPASNTEFQFVQVESGSVSGFEVEFRKNLELISPALKDFKVGGNFAFIRSSMNIPANSRFIPENRTFEGQSPFLANANISYSKESIGFQSTLAYNYVGRRLSSLGNQAPDNYLAPFNTLNLTINQQIKNYSINFSANNLLNNNVTESLIYKGQEYVTDSYLKGISFKMGVTYKY